jgi:hypothetical protein
MHAVPRNEKSPLQRGSNKRTRPQTQGRRRVLANRAMFVPAAKPQVPTVDLGALEVRAARCISAE